MRQDRTNEIKVLPATAEHWVDIEKFFADQACWCQYWRMSASEYGRYAKGPAWEKQVQLRRFQVEGFRKVAESDARTAGLARWVMRLDF